MPENEKRSGKEKKKKRRKRKAESSAKLNPRDLVATPFVFKESRDFIVLKNTGIVATAPATLLSGNRASLRFFFFQIRTRARSYFKPRHEGMILTAVDIFPVENIAVQKTVSARNTEYPIDCIERQQRYCECIKNGLDNLPL